ncbi:hypothetical protein FIV42_10385 [Persicimonas caeni]|uniref:SMI1/KNR4 family protein n=1 Tax=Persicimonas caeni TaxID=2292766 RepID=A0A4Y6PSX9_PERCE|nr:hypothetical protein [Persicimonas caeni]QDG51127.1 hypothetical protein FIV42_10385 [Persicimonas caeni]QED32348.1 hypothetical protein FRD00_10380 [Persicimonas caeni]
MTVEELQQWLEEHIDKIFTFMDYEPTIDSEEEFATTMGYWFGDEGWTEAGYEFAHLGIDGMGSQFAAWIRPGAEGPPPVVYFGSEGGSGVLVRSPRDWAMVLAYAPGVDEYPTFTSPARLDPELNWMLEDDDPDAAAEAERALEHYRAACVERFGDVPSFEELTSGLDELNEEFRGWIDDVVGE